MTRLLFILATASGFVLVAPAAAQYLPPTAALLLRYDVDQNGIVTQAEVGAGVDADYRLADANSDNCIDSDEMRDENDRRLARDGGVTSPIADWNLDGCVNMNEFGNSIRNYFDYADRSNDGEVSTAELQGPSMPITLPTPPTIQEQQTPMGTATVDRNPLDPTQNY